MYTLILPLLTTSSYESKITINIRAKNDTILQKIKDLIIKLIKFFFQKEEEAINIEEKLEKLNQYKRREKEIKERENILKKLQCYKTIRGDNSKGSIVPYTLIEYIKEVIQKEKDNNFFDSFQKQYYINKNNEEKKELHRLLFDPSRDEKDFTGRVNDVTIATKSCRFFEGFLESYEAYNQKRIETLQNK